MSVRIEKPLSENEITFCIRFESEILPNRRSVDAERLKEIGALVGIDVNTSCRNCAARGATAMLNFYNSIKPKYDLHMLTSEKLEKVFDEDVKEIKKAELIEESIPEIEEEEDDK